MAEPRFLIIGEVRRPHGVRGELKVTIHSDDPGRFSRLERIWLSRDQNDPDPVPHAIERARPNKDELLLKLAGVDSPESADRLRRFWLFVPVEEALPLEEGEYYLYQLIGMAVQTAEGEPLGTLTEVLETGANNVFVVHDGERELLLPDIDEVIRAIDFDSRLMTVSLMDGLR